MQVKNHESQNTPGPQELCSYHPDLFQYIFYNKKQSQQKSELQQGRNKYPTGRGQQQDSLDICPFFSIPEALRHCLSYE